MEGNVLATVAALLVLALANPGASGTTPSQPADVPKPPAVSAPQEQGTAAPRTSQGVTGFAHVDAPTANVRSGPGTNYPVAARAREGARVELVSEHNGWYQVKVPGGGVGWISGTLLVLPPDVSRTEGSKVEILAYYTENYRGDRDSLDSLIRGQKVLTAIAPFSYGVDSSGNVTGTHSVDGVSFAKSKGIASLALVHNIKNGAFNRGIVSAMLRNPAARRAAVYGILKHLALRGYTGVNIDFENVPPSDRQNLTEFMRELAAALKPRGYRVTMSVPAKASDSPGNEWSGAFDYYALGQIVDQLAIMTYDQHGSGYGPGPVASYEWVESVIRYALTQVPSHKILLGVPAYGYDWNLSTKRAKALSYAEAISTANRYGITPLWDGKALSPYYRYTSSGLRREVWFESRFSLGFKLDLVGKYKLGGIAMWRLGQEDPGVWQVIEDKLL